jgi:hypothetical protein
VPAVAGVEFPEGVGALRREFFGELLRKPWLPALIGVGALAAGLGAGIAVTPILGLAAAACVVLCGLAAIFVAAWLLARQDFFAIYAREHGLGIVKEDLPEVTPLLAAGTGRDTDLAMRGELSQGVVGTLAHYTYSEYVPGGGQGSSGGSAAVYKLTVVLIDVPGMQDIPLLLCHGRHGSQRTDKVDDALRRPRRKRLELESEALDRRFEIFADPDQDEVRLRRLFSPSFIVWLAESMPTAFELFNGHLCCFAAGHLDSAAKLDELVAGAVELRHRLRAAAPVG